MDISDQPNSNECTSEIKVTKIGDSLDPRTRQKVLCKSGSCLQLGATHNDADDHVAESVTRYPR